MKGFMKRFLAIFYLIFLSMPIINAQNWQGNSIKARHLEKNGEYVPGVMLVKFKDFAEISVVSKNNIFSTGISSIDQILAENRVFSCTKVFNNETRTENEKENPVKVGLTGQVPALFNIYRLEADKSADIGKIINDLQMDSNVEYAEPDYLVYSLGNLETIPNDPLYSQQPWLVTINAPPAWDSVTGDTTQVIAIIDTGVDWTHPDLAPNIWRNVDEIPGNNMDDDNNGFTDDVRGWDFINNDNNPADDNSHGTHVAGIAAAKGNNGIGITGVAWNAKIMPVKILQSSGTGATSGIATAINYAATNGATVINLSLGYYTESQTVKAALQNAYSTAVLVAAAGNDGYCICNDCQYCFSMFPACYPFVIGVMASGPGADFSNFDPSGPATFSDNQEYNYEIAAPGVNILSTLPFGTYGLYSGTSMAAPMVAGAVALMKSYDPDQSTETLFCRMIQGSSGGTLNILNSFDPELAPGLIAMDLTMYDTMPGGNSNGIANSGESLNYTLTVMNTGGWADSVHVTMTLQNLADTIYASILDSLCYLGDISTYGSIPSTDPLVVAIDSTTPHNTKIGIIFQLESNNYNPLYITDSITAYRTDLLHGNLDSTLVLTPDKRWIVYPWFNIEPEGKLIIMPGTDLDLQYAGISNNWGEIIGIGTPDSMINIYGPECLWGGYATISYARFKGARCQNMREGTFNHCEFYDSQLPFTAMYNFYKFYDCLFKNIGFMGIDGPGPCERSNFVQCTGYITIETHNCNFSEMGDTPNIYHSTYYRNGGNGFIGNNFLTAPDVKIYLGPVGDVLELAPNYWGTTDTVNIDEKIIDFWEEPAGAIVKYQPILTQPSGIAHGVVWRVLINGQDPQDDPMDPLGECRAKFDVCFNRPMDTAYTPLLTFSAWSPYTHRRVNDSAFWNADSTIWTAYYNITKETGDGINVIKVSGAKDNEGWDIPPEFNNRFKFVIQAASAASIEFVANAGLDHVDLEWPPANTDDFLGYYLYRFAKNGETLVADTIRLNISPIIDTIFIDTNMAIGPTYYYFYRILGTDLKESPRSKFVTAVPFLASEGDANGDLAVNILDITTVIYKILGENPQPYYAYSADVNDDNAINILDIVGIINIINGNNKSAGFSGWIFNDPAMAYLEDNNAYIVSNGQVSALYFELDNTTVDPGSIKLIAEGFELACNYSGQNVKGIIYSLENKTIPPGIQNIFTLDDRNENLTFKEIYGSDPQGRFITFERRSPSDINPDDLILKAYPNPFESSVTLSYFLPCKASIELGFYNQLGQEIDRIYYSGQDPGLYELEWNGSRLSPGLYSCVFKAETSPGVYFFRTLKLILVRP
jgi:subtilisin family serine protease